MNRRWPRLPGCDKLGRPTESMGGWTRVSRSSYRPIQIATASFLSLVVVALVISASLTWREGNRLEVAQEQLTRIHVFERAYLEIQLTLAAGLSEQWQATEARWIGLHP